MRKVKQDINQTVIPFDEAIWRIDGIKAQRKEMLQNETIYFRDKPKELDFLLKITYDITDKDFEYLCKYILEKWEHYSKLQVLKDDYARGEDIEGYDDKCLPCSIQCKQWSDLNIDIKKVGEYFAQTFEIREKNPKKSFTYITTSYINESAQRFLKKYGIRYIHNTELVKICKKIGLLDEVKWSEFISNLKNDRLMKLRDSINQSQFDNLKEARLHELTHHLPKYMHPEKIIISWSHIKKDHPFFQYWDLV